MDSTLYLKLSALMFLEFAVWGAWYPVLAARLLGPLKFSGKQTGWIYAALPLACIFMPLLAGQLADRYLNTEWILAGAHLIGVFLLFIAAMRRDFKSLFTVIFLYSLCYAATLPLVNSLMFRQLDDASISRAKSGYIFMWAPIAWALAGYFLTGWRWRFKTGEEGRDCLFLASVLSIVMVVVSLLMPATLPKAGEGGMHQALSMLGQSDFLIFIIISIVGAGMMQFYFLGTARFMQDNGIAPKNVPAAMAVAQATQAAATLALLGLFVAKLHFKWTLTIGAISWLVLYILYVVPRPPWAIVVAQAFHGLAYVFFIIAGQVFAGSVAPKGADASMQALIFTAQSGIGLFLGTQLAGVVMDRFRVGERFQWRKIWMVPGAIMLVCVIALVLFFRGTL
jgi:MFS family permease